MQCPFKIVLVWFQNSDYYSANKVCFFHNHDFSNEMGVIFR